jgi:acyl-CoA thioesterase-1
MLMIATKLSKLFVAFFVYLWLLSSPVFSATMLVWGDSLSAAYNIPVEQGWVAQLEQRLQNQVDSDWTVINGSVSGETSGGGLARLAAVLSEVQPDIFILGLGSNDGLRGQSLKQLNANLSEMIALTDSVGAKTLLLGNRIPPNYGKVYTSGFAAVYTDISTQKGVPLVPFLLEGVASDFALMQSDGLHPTAAAQARLLENVWSYLEPVLSAVQ